MRLQRFMLLCVAVVSNVLTSALRPVTKYLSTRMAFLQAKKSLYRTFSSLLLSSTASATDNHGNSKRMDFMSFSWLFPSVGQSYTVQRAQEIVQDININNHKTEKPTQFESHSSTPVMQSTRKILVGFMDHDPLMAAKTTKHHHHRSRN